MLSTVPGQEEYPDVLEEETGQYFGYKVHMKGVGESGDVVKALERRSWAPTRFGWDQRPVLLPEG